MKIRVDVVGEEQRNRNDKRYQTLAVHYPSAVLPVEQKLWLGQGAALKPGQYALDLNTGLKPDPRNFNEPRFDFRDLKPAVAPAQAKVG
jgi:hypothetical protein